MMSASAMSAAIRSKKKKMKEDQSAVKLSGIPEDATDHHILKQHEMGEDLSANEPKDHEEDPSLESLKNSDSSNSDEPHEKAPDPMQDDEKKKKSMKIKAVFSKLGR